MVVPYALSIATRNQRPWMTSVKTIAQGLYFLGNKVLADIRAGSVARGPRFLREERQLTVGAILVHSLILESSIKMRRSHKADAVL